MSIYGTMRDWQVAGHTVFFQDVNGEITDDGPRWQFLSPPTKGGYDDVRDVFVVCCCTGKGTKRNGQEYIDPLIHMSYRQYTEWMATKANRARLRRSILRRLEPVST